MEEFKQVQRRIWSAGDYASLSEHIADVGERVVDRAGVEPGMQVLDVACGAGNAALPAARTGAEVTGLDLVADLLGACRRQAEASGVEINCVEGDAEDLPFEDASFDRVLSTFGHMFAPRHERVAAEMARVCRPGGVIATCTWLPDGTVGEVFAASAAYMPPPPEFASSPILWGQEDHVREMFGDLASEIEFERHVNTVEWESVDAFGEVFTSRFGPLVTAREMLGERFGELREKLDEIWNRRNESEDGGLRLPQQYLLSIVRL
jgi:ubiquinone/menaquinone biosynthesis C-methylase UbiE